MNDLSRRVPAPPPELEGVVGHIGWAVVFLGRLETSMKQMIAMAFSDNAQAASQVFETLARADDRATMGMLTRRLREKSSLEPHFDDLLGVVLEKRNLLIHRLHEIPGSNLLTPDGRTALIEYCDELLSEASLLHAVVLTVIANWLDEQGIDLGGEEKDFARELQARHGHHLVQTFFSRHAKAPDRSMWRVRDNDRPRRL